MQEEQACSKHLEKMSDINCDELQREINEAEKYLEKKSTVSSLRTSQENKSRSFASYKELTADKESDDSVNSSKYSSPAEREKLINRLLDERNRKLRSLEPSATHLHSSSSGHIETIRGEVSLTPKKSFSSPSSSPERGMRHFSAAPSHDSSGDYYSGIAANTSISRDDSSEGLVFYASELPAPRGGYSQLPGDSLMNMSSDSLTEGEPCAAV